jgi:hypothetical protein
MSKLVAVVGFATVIASPAFMPQCELRLCAVARQTIHRSGREEIYALLPIMRNVILAVHLARFLRGLQ